MKAKIILVWCSDMKKPSSSNTNADKKILFDIASILSATVSPNHPNLETVTTSQYTLLSVMLSHLPLLENSVSFKLCPFYLNNSFTSKNVQFQLLKQNKKLTVPFLQTAALSR